MNAQFKAILAIVGTGASALLFPTHAHAGCGASDFADVSMPAWSLPMFSRSSADAASMAAPDAADEMQSQDDETLNGSDQARIVGFWNFTFFSLGNPGIPDGTVIDAGFVTWHSDGTELTNSSRPPITGNFCMGAWKQSGSYYRLNHYGLSWDLTGTVFIGPANIREQVRVDRFSHDHYAGTFTIDQYAPDGSTLLVHIGGTVAALRITAD